MTCEQLAQVYDEYALGVLEGEERAELEQHLARACPNCTPGVAEARGIVSSIGARCAYVEPSPELRAKIVLTRAVNAPGVMQSAGPRLLSRKNLLQKEQHSRRGHGSQPLRLPSSPVIQFAR